MKKISLLLFACAILLGSCGKKGETGAADSTANNLTGAGSTFINPIMTKWIDSYKTETGVSINYQSVGSGAGINNLIDHTVDFAGSDAPMNQGELDRAKAAVVHLPAVIGAVCVAYNINGVQGGLQLSGPVLSKIFMGKITSWDDAEIKKMNPTVKLPHDKIFTVHRSDGSGTTAIFTNYLSAVSPEWKDSVHDGKTVNWPNGLGGKGNAGVAGILKEHANSIGYVELAYAVQNNITFASIQNAAGNFIAPSVESASVAADGITLPDNMCAFITNTPNPQGYPITGFSWLIMYKDSPKAAAVKKFLAWVLSKGQDATKPLYYAPIPESIRANEMKLVDTTAHS